MNRICCWLSMGLLLLTLTVGGKAQSGSKSFIYTVNSDYQWVRWFEPSRNLWLWQSDYLGNLPWGHPSYIRVGNFDGRGFNIASPNQGTIMVLNSIGRYDCDVCLTSYPIFTVANQWGLSAYTWVGNFNGDFQDDIASADGPYVWMKIAKPTNLLSGPFEGFTSSVWPVSPSWGTSDYTWVGDFNGDGLDDIASAQGASVYMKISTGAGFVSQTWSVTNQWGSSAYTRVGDFNGDGRTDIASPNAGQVYMKLSTGSGFISATWSVANTWGDPGYVWVADFNNDSRSDFASAQGGVVHMKLSQGASFGSYDFSVTNQWGQSGYTWIMDYDWDGYKDIVSAIGGYVYIKKNNFGISFTSEVWPQGVSAWGPPAFTWARGRPW
ncbi:MAG TPA: VCBS repeat-containing protein [Blastocatellia bacterium]|nr:VCBS repeat-containing protein [Blastocatellia bacterium]